MSAPVGRKRTYLITEHLFTAERAHYPSFALKNATVRPQASFAAASS